VLVAGEAGETSNGALRLGELLARRDRVNVHVLGITRSLGFPISAFANVDAEALEAGRRAQLLEQLRQRVYRTVGRSALFSVDAATGSPARLLAAAAEERGSACVLIGLPNLGTPERAATEDEVLQIASIAEVPVIAVPPDSDVLPTRALVALDFGEGSRSAARMAAHLLGTRGTLTMAHAEPEGELRALGQEGLAEIYEHGVAALFAKVKAEIEDASDVSVETMLLKGDPATSLLSVISSGSYELIASGTQGVSALDRHFAGSVSTALLRGSAGIVLIAPPGPAATG
jgi:nucleotide-binding universal stress UspA family protein